LDVVAYETPPSDYLSDLENTITLNSIHSDLHPFPTPDQLPQEAGFFTRDHTKLYSLKNVVQ